MKLTHLFIAVLILLSGCACNSATPTPTATMVLPQPTSTQIAFISTSTEIVQPTIVATGAETQLPHNLVTSSQEYCDQPPEFLPAKDAEKLSIDEIAFKLMDNWLSYYKGPETHPY